MRYPQYLWITYYWFSEGWWLDPIASCTAEELVVVINQTIAVDYYPDTLPDEQDNPTNVGFVSDRSQHVYTGVLAADEARTCKH